jgi:hypothetical protein
MDDAKSVAEEPRISLVTSLSSEAYVLLESEAKREGKPIGEVLDRLILEGCILDEGLPLESHIVDLEKLNKRPETSFDKFNPI